MRVNRGTGRAAAVTALGLLLAWGSPARAWGPYFGGVAVVDRDAYYGGYVFSPWLGPRVIILDGPSVDVRVHVSVVVPAPAEPAPVEESATAESPPGPAEAPQFPVTQFSVTPASVDSAARMWTLSR